MVEWLIACFARDSCVTGLAAVAQAVATLALVGITISYAIATHRLVTEQQRDRAASFLPLLLWQSPAASIGLSGEDWTGDIRRRLNLVLWNIGTGAARLTHANAQNVEGRRYTVVHLDVPSVVPANVQVTLRLFRDQDTTDLIDTNDGTLRQEDVTVTLHYEDVVERHHYETHVTVRCRFDEAQGGKMGLVKMPPEPPVAMDGFGVTAAWLFSDPRSASERVVSGRCATCSGSGE